MRVVVVGSAGRMGSAVCRAVDADQDLELAAAVDPSSSGSEDPTGTVICLLYTSPSPRD